MSTVWEIIADLILAFIVVMVIRLIFDYVQMFARDWRPRGGVLVVLELCYSVTDPPLFAIRGVVPPLRAGRFPVDVGWLALFIGALILRQVALSL